jgi:hypothetical protein
MSFCSHSHITVDKELGTGKCHDCGANLKFAHGLIISDHVKFQTGQKTWFDLSANRSSFDRCLL